MDYPVIHNPVKFKYDIITVKDNKAVAIPGRYREQRVTFQAVMKLTIILGQFVGLNPVLGISDVDTTKLRFTYLSGRCAYTIITIFLQTIFLNILFLLKYFKDSETSIAGNNYTLRYILWVIEKHCTNRISLIVFSKAVIASLTSNESKTTLSNWSILSASLVFYTSNTILTVLFLQIATKWPKLCRYISWTETADPVMDNALVKKCNISCLLVLSLACVEHGLSELSGLVFAADCNPQGIYEALIVHGFPWINDFMNYSISLGVLTQFLNLQCTFNWNFSNLFVINISLYLTSRLEQINKKISAVQGKSVPSSFWRNMREDYNRASSLVRKVDKVIGGIIFISFANNLFFICLQLLHTLAGGVKPTPSCQTPDERIFHGYEQGIYFLYSLIFLIVRSLAVSLIAAQVHTASRKPVHALYEVPSADYGIEVQRFIEQIHGDTVALTGLQFFKVKRGIALAIAGTIVTYELVLMQFAGVTPATDMHTDV